MEILFLFAGALLGVVFTVWFQRPFEIFFRKLNLGLIRLLRRLKLQHAPVTSYSAEFIIGPLKADYIVVEGNGIEEIKENNLKCYYDSENLIIPKDLKSIKRKIEKEQKEAKKQGNEYFWNGKLYGLGKFIRNRTPDEEEITLDLWFRPSDYYTYLATVMSLDTYVKDELSKNITVRQKYLSNPDWNTVIPYMATGFGVAISLISSDDILVIAKRGRRGVGPWKDYFSTAVNEGLSRILDMNEKNHQPDPYRAVVRGAMEELNIEIERSSIRFLTFGFETRQYQWGLQGYAYVNLTAAQIRERRTMGAKDKWETDNLFFIRFEPKTVIQFMLDNEPWTPFGMVCVIHTLMNQFGHESVIRTIEREFKRRKKRITYNAV